MTDFLLRLLQMSAAGSLLAGLIFLWRRLLRRKAVHAIFYYMWLVVLLRLCVPFGVTVSLPGTGEAGLETEHISPADEGAGQPIPSENAASPDTAKADTADTPSPLPVSAVLQKAARGLADFFGSPVLWMILWGTGALVCLRGYIVGYIRFARAVRRVASEVSPEAREMLRALDPDGRVHLMECPFVNTPMLIGVLRPTIVLPTGIGDGQRLRDILMHELVHARRYDLVYKWFAAAVTSLHWFNPVMVLVRREIGRACELSCDEALMRGMDEKERRHYGETLLALAASPAGSGLVAMTLCEEKKQLKERLVSIATYRKRGTAAVLASVATFAAIFLGGCAMVPGANFAEDDFTPAVVAEEEKHGEETDEAGTKTDEPQTGNQPQTGNRPQTENRPQTGNQPQTENQPQDGGANVPAEGGAQSPGSIGDMYRFAVRVSDARVLAVALETSEPEKNYFSVDRIYVYDGDTVIQTIETADLTPSDDYLWEGLYVNRGHSEGEPDVRDVTFDGAEDFGLLCASAYPKNLPFTYFYWDEASGRFVQGVTIFGGDALEVDYEQKCLVEHAYDVYGDHITRYA